MRHFNHHRYQAAVPGAAFRSGEEREPVARFRDEPLRRVSAAIKPAQVWLAVRRVHGEWSLDSAGSARRSLCHDS